MCYSPKKWRSLINVGDGFFAFAVYDFTGYKYVFHKFGSYDESSP